VALFFSTFNEKPSRNQHYGRTRCSRELTPNGAEKKAWRTILLPVFGQKNKQKRLKGSLKRCFKKRDYTSAQEVTVPKDMAQPLWIIDLLKHLGAISSSSEGKRLIESKSIRINDELISDFNAKIACSSGMIIKVGKHRIYKNSVRLIKNR